MRRMNIGYLAHLAREKGKIEREDVVGLHENFFNGEELWPPAARALFDLLQARLPACAEWNDFIADAISHYMVDQLEPRGRLDDKNARFLEAMLSRDTVNWSAVDLSILVATMNRAGAAPPRLQAFALQLSRALLAAGRIGAEAQRAEEQKEELAQAA